jgi:prepilin-type N-terminal cleavage/methylation domain-containing protein
MMNAECRIKAENRGSLPRSSGFPSAFCIHHSAFMGTGTVDTLNNAKEELPLKRRAFTLIEVLVVIALLVLLSALVIMAIGHMQTNGKRQQTRLLLQNLQAMFADYDVNRRVPFGAGDMNLGQMSTWGNVVNAIAMTAPGDVTTGAADRTSAGTNQAVAFTRDFMTQLMSIPSNATAIGKLPSGSSMTFPVSNPPTLGVWSGGTIYNVFDTVTYPDSNGNSVPYVRTLINVDSSGNLVKDGGQQAPPNYYYWMPALQIPLSGTPLTTPVPLDAWGNPIIFVMGGVLNVNGAQIHSPDYHPFFASAGPDGNFAKGDDNLYSFEK